MSDRIEWFAITVPAGTPVASPLVFPTVFQQGEVTQIDVKVPPGPHGNVGFFIGAGGSQYVPRTPGSFVVPDNDYFTWPVENAINSGSWSVTAYNTDVYPHTFQVGFQISEIGTAHMSNVSLLPSSSAGIPETVTTVPPELIASPDPLSADFLISSVPPDVLDQVTSGVNASG